MPYGITQRLSGIGFPGYSREPPKICLMVWRCFFGAVIFWWRISWMPAQHKNVATPKCREILNQLRRVGPLLLPLGRPSTVGWALLRRQIENRHSRELRRWQCVQRPSITLRRGMTSVAHQAPCGRPACASLDPQLADRLRLEPAVGYRDLSGRVVCCTSRPRFSRCDSSAAR